MNNGHWEKNRDWLLPLLVCPDCGDRLGYVHPQAAPAHLEGYLLCNHCGEFPVITGIPRLLPEKYLHVYLAKYYPDILEILNSKKRFKHLAKIDKDEEIVIRTMFSFGYQWNTFNEDHMVWGKEYERCMSPLKPEHFSSDKIVADIGCGMGRMIYRASQEKARFVGIDLSNAIESASQLCKNKGNVIFIQADILNPPFKERSFDTIYSVGVLHHLPGGISKGITILIKLLKDSGFLHTWLYGNQRGDDKISFGIILRKLIKKFPLRLIYIFAYVHALCVLLLINYPALLLSKISVLKVVASKFPFHSWRTMNLKAIACNVFDYYATPIEFGYDKNLLELEISKHHLIDWKLEALSTPLRRNESWYLYGRKSNPT